MKIYKWQQNKNKSIGKKKRAHEYISKMKIYKWQQNKNKSIGKKKESAWVHLSTELVAATVWQYVYVQQCLCSL